MTIQFKQSDSLYKIFKILKKVPPYKQVSIFIDPKHELFQHKRRAQQLVELIHQQHINAVFLVDNKEQHEYFSNSGLVTHYRVKQGLPGLIERIKNTLYGASASKQLLAKKNAKSYLILAAEIAVLGLVGTFFWGLVSPKAVVTISPSNEIIPIVYQYGFYPAESGPTAESDIHGQITIPYYQGSVPYNQEMTVDVQDITYTYTQARGRVSFENTLPEEISLVGGTQLVNTGGIIFTLDERINIPAGSPDDPGVVTMSITARASTDEGVQIGEQSNIPKSTPLYIKNLEESIDQKRIVAYAMKDFTGGETIGKGTVIQKDIDAIEEKILAMMKKNKRAHLQEQLLTQDTLIVIPYDELIELSIDTFISTSTVGESATFVHGVTSGELSYKYVLKEDYLAAVEKYLLQRPLEGKFLVDFDPHSMTFYEYRPDEENPAYFSIPLGINTIRGYNFLEDQFALGEEMVNDITGLSRKKAKETLLGYDAVRDVTVRLSPPRYDTLPLDPKRISIKHTITD